MASLCPWGRVVYENAGIKPPVHAREAETKRRNTDLDVTGILCTGPVAGWVTPRGTRAGKAGWDGVHKQLKGRGCVTRLPPPPCTSHTTQRHTYATPRRPAVPVDTAHVEIRSFNRSNTDRIHAHITASVVDKLFKGAVTIADLRDRTAISQGAARVMMVGPSIAAKIRKGVIISARTVVKKEG